MLRLRGRTIPGIFRRGKWRYQEKHSRQPRTLLLILHTRTLSQVFVYNMIDLISFVMLLLLLYTHFQPETYGRGFYAQYSRESERDTDHKQSGYVNRKGKSAGQTTDKRFHQGTWHKGVKCI